MATKPNPLAKANEAKKTRARRASKMTEVLVAASGETPLQHMLGVMRDPKVAADVRLDAAKAAAPYVHPKLQSIVHEGGDKPIQFTEIRRTIVRAGS